MRTPEEEACTYFVVEKVVDAVDTPTHASSLTATQHDVRRETRERVYLAARHALVGELAERTVSRLLGWPL